MPGLLIFAVALLIAVLFSEYAQRSVLSTSVLFLAAGVIVGREGLGLIVLHSDDRIVSIFADLALFSVLFTDGMGLGADQLRAAWTLPGRALFLGMPITFLLTAVAAHVLVGLAWPYAFLIGAVLSPTDPVFAEAIVGRQDLPERLRFLLNVESGFNDGLALPVVVALLAFLGSGESSALTLATEIGLGLLIGVSLPWLGALLMRAPFFSVSRDYEPFYALSLGMILLAVTRLTHANEYIAAFSAGITIASISPQLRDEFRGFGNNLAELLKLAALLAFGALISPSLLGELGWSEILFAVLVIAVARPLALELSLVSSRFDWRERLLISWFGPKGFASVVYGLLVLRSGIAIADHLFALIALVVAGSIIAHSSTDVPMARWFTSTNDPQRGEF